MKMYQLWFWQMEQYGIWSDANANATVLFYTSSDVKPTDNTFQHRENRPLNSDLWTSNNVWIFKVFTF